MSAPHHQEVTAEEDGLRLDRWFRLHYPALPHALLNKLVRKGQVRVDGGRAKTNTRLERGQTVRVPPLDVKDDNVRENVSKPSLSKADRRLFQDMVLHEDADIFVLNKPAGLAVQGGSRTVRHIDGLLMGLERELGERPRLVHRLDRDTSGVLVVAKRRSVAAKLGKLFATRSVRKIYWAAVKGLPKPAQGRVDKSLAKIQTQDGERVREAQSNHKDDGRSAVTYYSVVDRAGSKLSWVSLKPVTGRQHQLRAHMAMIGHPILGDGKYGGLDGLPAGIEPKLHLHARRIVFPHPSGGTLDVTAPLPAVMRRTWELVGFDPDRYDDGPSKP